MSYFVIYDDPARGGDGTFLSDSKGDDLWVHDRDRARIMVQTEAELALGDVDPDEILRDRLRIMHASWFRLPLPRVLPPVITKLDESEVAE